MEVVKIENITRVYQVGKVETQALRGVSLSIGNGEFTASGRTLWLWKDNAFANDRLSRSAHLRDVCSSTTRKSPPSTATSAPICAVGRLGLSSNFLR